MTKLVTRLLCVSLVAEVPNLRKDRVLSSTTSTPVCRQISNISKTGALCVTGGCSVQPEKGRGGAKVL
jgi:hypothetical protein